MQYLGGTGREAVESVTLFHMTMSELCRVLSFGVESRFPSVARAGVYRLSVAGRGGSFETDSRMNVWCPLLLLPPPLLLHLLRWAASDQPEPCLQRAGAASNPILCSKVKQTSHSHPPTPSTPLSLMCSPTPESHLCHCTSSSSRRQEAIQRKEKEDEEKEISRVTIHFSSCGFVSNADVFLEPVGRIYKEEHNNSSTKWRIKRVAAFKPPPLVGGEAEPGLVIEQWFFSQRASSMLLYLLQMEAHLQ